MKGPISALSWKLSKGHLQARQITFSKPLWVTCWDKTFARSGELKAKLCYAMFTNHCTILINKIYEIMRGIVFQVSGTFGGIVLSPCVTYVSKGLSKGHRFLAVPYRFPRKNLKTHCREMPFLDVDYHNCDPTPIYICIYWQAPSTPLPHRPPLVGGVWGGCEGGGGVL